MRTSLLLVVLTLIAVSACASQATPCAALDPTLIHCPTPQAPRVTELKDGQVVVQLTVRPDGSVADAHVVSSSGHTAWKDTVLGTVQHWRYKPSGHGATKVVPFGFTVGG